MLHVHAFLLLVYGWNTPRLIARERDEPYNVQVVVEKGLSVLIENDGLPFSRLTYEVRLVPGGSASKENYYTLTQNPAI